MARTIEQIASSVLSKLGRLPEGQTITGGQLSTVQDEYEELYGELLSDSLVDWASDDDIPDRSAGPIKILLLGRLADNYGVENKWLALDRFAKTRLGSMIAEPYVPHQTEFENI